eukprot:2181423-Amphidinium_carterae.1
MQEKSANYGKHAALSHGPGIGSLEDAFPPRESRGNQKQLNNGPGIGSLEDAFPPRRREETPNYSLAGGPRRAEETLQHYPRGTASYGSLPLEDARPPSQHSANHPSVKGVGAVRRSSPGTAGASVVGMRRSAAPG